MTKTIVGLYDELATARDAVRDLTDFGINIDDINLMAADPDQEYGAHLGDTDYEDVDYTTDTSAVPEGVAVGAVLGGLGGLVAGLSAVMVPGVGPVIAAGPLAATLLGLGVGAAVGGVVGALVDVGVPEEHASYYAEGVRRGGTLVVVKAMETDVEDVTAIMRRHDPVDIEQRAAEWRAGGWTGLEDEWYADYEDYEPSFRRHYTTNYAATGDGDTYNRYETAYRYGHDIAMDERYGDYEWEEIEPDAQRGWEERDEGDYDWQDVSDAVRYGWTEVRDGWDTDYQDDYTEYEPGFRRHYQATYAGTPYSYDVYAPAYRYGYDLAANPQYRDRDWSDIEPQARRRWEAEEDTAWEDVSQAVRHAWDEVEDAFGDDDADDYDRVANRENWRR